VLEGLQSLASQLCDTMLLGSATEPALTVLERATALLSRAYALPECVGASKEGETNVAQGGLASWQERAITRYIDSRLHAKFSLQGLAAVVELSPSHFCRACRRSFQCSPMQLVMQRRVIAAKQLLRKDVMTLRELALFCGFADQAHFTRVFRAATGDTPRRWRQIWRHFTGPHLVAGLDHEVSAELGR
jgi:AraC-like DNA-binding protein